MNNDSSARTQVALSLLPRLNSHICLPLIEKCGGIEGFFLENEKALNALYQEFNIPSGYFDRTAALQKAEEELRQTDRSDIRICSVEHALYPALLRQCADAPLVFFYKGNLPAAFTGKYLAIVGTRKASERCRQWVNTVISDLCSMNIRPIIVSGLAYGIDATAHRASLSNGLLTFAVLGHGLHMIYPASHKTLAHNILASGGALISEFPCTAPVYPGNFLKRNRIIAGLSHATLIAESALKGGAMTTARLAISYDRDVMALPGRPEDFHSAGCNRLIKENIAALTENAEDIARILNYPVQKQAPSQMNLQLVGSEKQEQLVLEILLRNKETDIDSLCRDSGIPLGELSALLLQMELEGKILALPGKRFMLR